MIKVNLPPVVGKIFYRRGVLFKNTVKLRILKYSPVNIGAYQYSVKFPQSPSLHCKYIIILYHVYINNQVIFKKMII